jgi:hypothetical protein
MSGAITRRAWVIVGLAALAAGCLGSWSVPAGAATTNPCKVLKRSEIQRAFGGTVSSGKKGLSTVASVQCEYQVAAAGDRPAGTVVVHVMTTGAKTAYTGLKKLSKSYTPIDGVPDSLWNAKLHVVNILTGEVLLGVQGGFTIVDPLPIHFYDDETQLTQLAQTGAKRV